MCVLFNNVCTYIRTYKKIVYVEIIIRVAVLYIHVGYSVCVSDCCMFWPDCKEMYIICDSARPSPINVIRSSINEINVYYIYLYYNLYS